MLIKFTKNITCNIDDNCDETILNKIEKHLGVKVHAETEKDQVCGHLSISHANKNHIIWLFLYEKDNTHESESQNNIKTEKSKRIKKYAGIIPTKTTISNLL